MAEGVPPSVAGVMDIINRAGGTVVWIGLPITRSEAQTQRFDIVNAVVQKEAKKRGSKAIFIDTYTMFAGNTGGFAEYLENAKGDTREGACRRRRPLRPRGRRHHRPRGAEAAQQDVRPDELAPGVELRAGARDDARPKRYRRRRSPAGRATV